VLVAENGLRGCNRSLGGTLAGVSPYCHRPGRLICRYDADAMPEFITYAEPHPLLRRLREHDLAGLRCHEHGEPPTVSSTRAGLSVEACCPVLAEAVRLVLGLPPDPAPSR